MLRFWLSITRLSLQLVFELRWEYAKTHHLSQLSISRRAKIKIYFIIHYTEFFQVDLPGMGVWKGCTPPSISAPPHLHTLSLCKHAGAHCHLSPAPFRTPALVHPPFCLPAAPPRLHTTMLTHPPPCTHAGCTVTLSHPCFGAPTLLFACSSPTWVAPHLTRMPFACIPPVLLRPWHECKERGCAGGAGCVNQRGGHGVVQAEGTVGWRACRAGA